MSCGQTRDAFSLSVYINTKTAVYVQWELFVVKPLHDLKLTASCGLADFLLIPSFVFEEVNAFIFQTVSWQGCDIWLFLSNNGYSSLARETSTPFHNTHMQDGIFGLLLILWRQAWGRRLEITLSWIFCIDGLDGFNILHYITFG